MDVIIRMAHGLKEIEYRKLSQNEIETEVTKIQGWNTTESGKISKEFQFKNFVASIRFYDKSCYGSRKNESSSRMV